ncbi:SPOR domain-containing protein [Rhodohalobacter sp.]|uniref:SPOR domain-containing protein n=1 Tax=Rhodohalobacter sp. TaxID=1974210 RepID=UPI0035632880
MKINRAKLVELLVEKTGMDADEIESQLKQLIDRILDAAERGKALEVKEFGMFYFDEHGNLKFDPADELSTEINFKYAGMEPVELKPARDQDSETQASDLSYEEEADETEDEPVSSTGSDMDEIFGFNADDQDLDEDEGPIEDDAEGPDGGALISPPDKVDRDIDPFSGLLGDASSKMKGSDEGDKDKDADEDDPFSFIPEEYEEQETEEDDETTKDEELEPIPGLEKEGEDDKDLELDPVFALDDDVEEIEDDDSDDLSKIFNEAEPEVSDVDEKQKQDFVAAKTAESKRDTKSKITDEKSEQRDPITMVISVGLIIILIVVGFLVIPSLFESDDSGTEAVTDPPEEQVDQTPEETQSVITPVEPEQETEVIEEEPVEQDPEQPVYGLMGDLVDEANDGYSIVLHSMESEARARSEAEHLASDGYRVLVTPRLVQGDTVWRVSVGQFSTISDAQQAAAELPNPYSSNNFIQRIQTN